MIKREQNLLDALKMNVTKTVTRKPNNSEGKNGDFAVGNTPEGPMIFMKVKNRWHSMNPRTATGNNFSTFKGHIYLMNFLISNNTADITHDHHGFAPLHQTWYLHDSQIQETFKSSWDVDSNIWRNQFQIPYHLPEHCTIDFIHSTHSVPSDGQTFEELESTLRIYELRSGYGDWDDANVYIGEDAHTLVDTATIIIKAQHTKFEYPINREHIYIKGSHIAFHISNKKMNEANADYLNQNFILRFMPKEKILEEER